MSLRSRRITATIALFLLFSITQVYVGVGFAEPSSGSGNGPEAVAPQQFTAVLTIRGRGPVTVNGSSVLSGATILTGATIETPDQVGATINLGSLGALDLAPNTKLTLEFDQNRNVKVTLIQGCAVLHTKKKTNGEIDTSQGVAGRTDSAKGGWLNVCFPPGATAPTVSTTAAGGAAGGGLFGLGSAATVAIIAGGIVAVALPLAIRGTNPSEISP